MELLLTKKRKVAKTVFFLKIDAKYFHLKMDPNEFNTDHDMEHLGYSDHTYISEDEILKESEYTPLHDITEEDEDLEITDEYENVPEHHRMVDADEMLEEEVMYYDYHRTDSDPDMFPVHQVHSSKYTEEELSNLERDESDSFRSVEGQRRDSVNDWNGKQNCKIVMAYIQCIFYNLVCVKKRHSFFFVLLLL